MIQNFLDEKEIRFLHMTQRERNQRKIFQGTSHYGKFSSVTYYDKASQYAAFLLCQVTCKLDLRQFKFEREGYNLRVDNNYIDCSFPDLMLLQLQQIMKRKQLQKSPTTVIAPVPDLTTLGEKS
jgi:hypothetical protein